MAEDREYDIIMTILKLFVTYKLNHNNIKHDDESSFKTTPLQLGPQLRRNRMCVGKITNLWEKSTNHLG